MSVSTNDLKRGMTLDLDGTLYQIIEFQHVKPGKGGAFVRTKLRNVKSGAVVDRTFNAHGLITNENLYGDKTVTGDERSAKTTYVPNTTDYVVSCPHIEESYSSFTQSAATLLAQTGNFYEGMSDWNQPALSCQAMAIERARLCDQQPCL